jgi:hypothetical protein
MKTRRSFLESTEKYNELAISFGVTAQQILADRRDGRGFAIIQRSMRIERSL